MKDAKMQSCIIIFNSFNHNIHFIPFYIRNVSMLDRIGLQLIAIT